MSIEDMIAAAVRRELAPLRSELAQLRRDLAQRDDAPTIDSAGACRLLGYIKDGRPNLPALNALLSRHASLRALAKKRGRRLLFEREALRRWSAEHRPQAGD